MSVLEPFLSDSVGIALPILAAALGGLYTEAAGALNIALEGLIAAGAFAFAAAAGTTGNIVLGLAAAMLASVSLALLIAYASDRLKADVFVAALAVNLLAEGAVSIASAHVFGTKGVVPLPVLLSPRVDWGALGGVPLLGPLLFRQRGVSYLAGLGIAALALAFQKTVFGLRVRAAGMRDEALRLSGVNPARVRYGAYAVSGVACALAGVALARSVGAWVPNISAGRGWIALVVIYLGLKRPGGIALASVGFGVLFAFSNAAQSFLAAPPELVLALPYAVTSLIVLLGGAAPAKRRRVAAPRNADSEDAPRGGTAGPPA